MHTQFKVLILIATLLVPAATLAQGRGGQTAQSQTQAPAPPDAKPVSITCEECPYPYPSKYFPLKTYGQDVRMAYMDVAPQGQPNGHTVVVLHGSGQDENTLLSFARAACPGHTM